VHNSCALRARRGHQRICGLADAGDANTAGADPNHSTGGGADALHSATAGAVARNAYAAGAPTNHPASGLAAAFHSARAVAEALYRTAAVAVALHTDAAIAIAHYARTAGRSNSVNPDPVRVVLLSHDGLCKLADHRCHLSDITLLTRNDPLARCVTCVLVLGRVCDWRSDSEPLSDRRSCSRPLPTGDRQAHDSAINASLQSSARTSELANNEHSASEKIELLSAIIISPLQFGLHYRRHSLMREFN